MGFDALSKRNYTLEQRKANAERQKRYYQKNREECTRKRRLKAKENRAKRREDEVNYARKNPERHLLFAAKRSATRRGLQFNLTLEDIIIPEYCPILNIKLSEVRQKDGAKPESPSVDRIDTTKGYIKGNVGIISWKANTHKSALTLEDIERLSNYIKGIK